MDINLRQYREKVFDEQLKQLLKLKNDDFIDQLQEYFRVHLSKIGSQSVSKLAVELKEFEFSTETKISLIHFHFKLYYGIFYDTTFDINQVHNYFSLMDSYLKTFNYDISLHANWIGKIYSEFFEVITKYIDESKDISSQRIEDLCDLLKKIYNSLKGHHGINSNGIIESILSKYPAVAILVYKSFGERSDMMLILQIIKKDLERLRFDYDEYEQRLLYIGYVLDSKKIMNQNFASYISNFVKKTPKNNEFHHSLELLREKIKNLTQPNQIISYVVYVVHHIIWKKE